MSGSRIRQLASTTSADLCWSCVSPVAILSILRWWPWLCFPVRCRQWQQLIVLLVEFNRAIERAGHLPSVRAEPDIWPAGVAGSESWGLLSRPAHPRDRQGVVSRTTKEQPSYIPETVLPSYQNLRKMVSRRVCSV